MTAISISDYSSERFVDGISTLSVEELDLVSGGRLGRLVLLYEAANIVYEFGQGFVEGFYGD